MRRREFSTTISEPQQGGSQVIVADLAVALTRHGHDVDVYAAAGSLIAGARVIETGIDSARLPAALIRPGQPRRFVRALDEAYEHVFGMVGGGGYDVVHSHGFDPPALRRSRAGLAPVVHTVRLPPEPEAERRRSSFATDRGSAATSSSGTGWRVRPAEEAELVEQRLRDDPAAVGAFTDARRDVDDFERAKTFLPAT
jgi:glycosyltransferase involved in cell wall biosynthesis